VSVDLALDHHERGLALLPLRARGKEPNLRVLREVHGRPEWRSLAKRPASAAEVRAWFDVDPDTNVGVILGSPSDGLVAVDFDRKATGVRHPPTPIVKTARGHHAFLRSDQPVKTREYPWGEIRGEGSYVVLPDSIHPTGHHYHYLVALDEVHVAPLSDLHLPGSSKEPTVGSEDVYTGMEYQLPVYPSNVPFRELGTHEESVRQALSALGIDKPIGAPFRCILPGHAEQHPSASIYRDPISGQFLYRDWHRRDGVPWLPLSWVRAALAYKRVKRLGAPEAARWYLRLFHDAGLLAPLEIDLPNIPAKSSATLRKVREGFELLLGLRWLRDPDTATPFTRLFASAWCGVGERLAGEAIAELLRLGVIEQADVHCVGPKAMRLFLPGSGRSRARTRR
jgi:Bifunctional DNA primase/polymerase, N-terminal